MGVHYNKAGNKCGWTNPKRRYREKGAVYKGAEEFNGYEGSIPATYHEKENTPIPAKMEYSDLFPNINATSYSTLGGREFLKDLLSQTRGQLILSLSKMSDRDFARTWIELNKFVMPQMTAADIQVGQKTDEQSLYAKMAEQVRDEDLEASTSHSAYGIETIEEAEVVEDNEDTTSYSEDTPLGEETTPYEEV